MCYVYIYVIYKNGMNCLNIGNAAKIENVLLPKTNVPIVLDDAMLLDDGLKYDNNDNDLYANNEWMIFVMTYEIANPIRFRRNNCGDVSFNPSCCKNVCTWLKNSTHCPACQ